MPIARPSPAKPAAKHAENVPRGTITGRPAIAGFDAGSAETSQAVSANDLADALLEALACANECIPPCPGITPPALPRRQRQEGRSPISWFGGKMKLARAIVGMMPEHNCYCEPFAGAAHVFFRKPPATLECLNDINGELINFYRQLKAEPLALLLRNCLALHSRQLFHELRDADPAAMTEQDRAWRFYYLCMTCFGARMARGNVCYGRNARGRSSAIHKLTLRPRRLIAAHQRLRCAYIECLPWARCIDLYDSADTLFYIDPPYVGHEEDYGKGIFTPEDFPALAARLAAIRGKFILSINDCPASRQIFQGFHLAHECSVKYTVCAARQLWKPELIFTNFTPPAPRKRARKD